MKIIIFISALVFSFSAFAEEAAQPYEVIEVYGQYIKLASDGTGLVSNVICPVCTSKLLTITSSTMAYEGMKPVNIVSAKKKHGNKVASVRFNIATNEVITVRW